MNDQIASLIRTVLKYGAGILVTKGITDSSTAEIIVSGLVALLGVVWSWAHHAAAGAAATEAGAGAAKPNGPPQGPPTLKILPLLLLLLLVLTVTIWSGCTVVSRDRVFPTLKWYWSPEAQRERASRKSDTSFDVNDTKLFPPLPAKINTPQETK